jgi:hypothetical protein
MIFPFGGEATASMVLPSQRPFSVAIPPHHYQNPPACLPPIPICIDPVGVGRDRHDWDKDGVCVFCDRRRISRKAIA